MSQQLAQKNAAVFHLLSGNLDLSGTMADCSET